MPSVNKVLYAIFLLFIFQTGNAQKCSPPNVELVVTNTGERSRADFVFEVSVKNTCSCTITDVFVRSLGFASSTPVDPKLFRREGSDYIVNDDKGIDQNGSVKFRYAWDRTFPMSPSSLKYTC